MTKRPLFALCAVSLAVVVLSGCSSLRVGIVPSLVGRQSMDRFRPIAEAGMEPGNTVYDPTSAETSETIVAQTPPPWTLAEYGTKVDVVIAGAAPKPVFRSGPTRRR